MAKKVSLLDRKAAQRVLGETSSRSQGPAGLFDRDRAKQVLQRFKREEEEELERRKQKSRDFVNKQNSQRVGNQAPLISKRGLASFLPGGEKPSEALGISLSDFVGAIPGALEEINRKAPILREANEFADRMAEQPAGRDTDALTLELLKGIGSTGYKYSPPPALLRTGARAVAEKRGDEQVTLPKVLRPVFGAEQLKAPRRQVREEGVLSTVLDVGGDLLEAGPLVKSAGGVLRTLEDTKQVLQTGDVLRAIHNLPEEQLLLPARAGSTAPKGLDLGPDTVIMSGVAGPKVGNKAVLPKQLVTELTQLDKQIRLVQSGKKQVTAVEARNLLSRRAAVLSDIQEGRVTQRPTLKMSQAEQDIIDTAERAQGLTGTGRSIDTSGGIVYEPSPSGNGLMPRALPTSEKIIGVDSTGGLIREGELTFSERLKLQTDGNNRLRDGDSRKAIQEDQNKYIQYLRSLPAEERGLKPFSGQPVRGTGSPAASVSRPVAQDVVVNQPAVSSQAQAIANRSERAGMGRPGEVATFNQVDGFMEQQRAMSQNLIRQDYEAAKRVALGQEKPPGDLTAERVLEDMAAEAELRGDVETVHQLAASPVASGSSRKGQEIASIDARDPESATVRIRELMEARRLSSRQDIPKTVSRAETEAIVTLYQGVKAKKEAWLARIDEHLAAGGSVKDRALLDDPAKLDYGLARADADEYVDGLVLAAKKRTFRQFVKEERIRGVLKEGVLLTGEVAKGLKATLDNSAIGRQGRDILINAPRVWLRNSLKTFDDIKKTIGGHNTKKLLRADILSRPNALDGTYKAADLDVFDVTEEAFPTELLHRVPGLGRLPKASDAAYTGFLQRSRADIADIYIDAAKKTGTDLARKGELKSIGELVNAMTGRGKLKSNSRGVNALLFSPKLLKSHLDVLTQPFTGGSGASKFVRIQATKNLIRSMGATVALLSTAGAMWPGSVTWDTKNSDFGKIKIGNTRVDITGGRAGLIVAASRLAGVIGDYLGGDKGTTTSSTTGVERDLNTGGHGDQTGWDVLLDFTENKLSPLAGALQDILEGKTFEGKAPTPKETALDLITPIIISNAKELAEDKNSAPLWAGILLEGLGLGTNTYGPRAKDWTQSTSKEIAQFRGSVGEDKFQEANRVFAERYDGWAERVVSNQDFRRLEPKRQRELLQNKARDLKGEIFKQYGFKYKRDEKTSSEKAEEKRLLGL